MSKIACITGYTGIIGESLARLLIEDGWVVRGLSRKPENTSFDQAIEHMQGDILNPASLDEFVKGAHAFFHCAGEIYDLASMDEVNVKGTNNVVKAIMHSEIEFFCYVSSAGVVGAAEMGVINEDSSCHPVETYEITKYQAEQCVLATSLDIPVVVVRPTNVVHERKPGVVGSAITNGFLDRLKCILKGSEHAHLVHAVDVAASMVHLYNLSGTVKDKQVYFVGCTEETVRVSDIYGYVRALLQQTSVKRCRSLPATFTYLLRSISRGKRIHGKVSFSSNKLMATGFSYPLGLYKGIDRIVRHCQAVQ